MFLVGKMGGKNKDPIINFSMIKAREEAWNSPGLILNMILTIISKFEEKDVKRIVNGLEKTS